MNHTLQRTIVTGLAVLVGSLALGASPQTPARAQAPARPQASPHARTGDANLAGGFTSTVRPFLEDYCLRCHDGDEPEGDLDLGRYQTLNEVVRDHERWAMVQEKLTVQEMPPEKAKKHPSSEVRQQIVDWIAAVRRTEARKHAGDPGPVLARRLSNAEYNYTVRDLTGVDIRPAREFPVDPANPAGFDNSGESLSMSPALMTKYLQAARDVSHHLVLKPEGIAFASHPMLVETDRDKYCTQQIIDFYERQNTDYADYFETAWRYKHRVALGTPKATLASLAAARGVSPKYLATIWRTLEQTKEDVGPLAALQTQWRALPAPKAKQTDAAARAARAGSEQMRDYVVQLRKKTAVKHTELSVKGLRSTSQPFLMWRNRQYAEHRMDFERSVLTPDAADQDLRVPADQRVRYEAAFGRFAAVFPDTFYISERGRYFPDNTRDTGRHLSAGFHNLMGYFRDDIPLYQLLLDDKQQRELDGLWKELDFVASANIRTHVQFYFNESGEARGTSRESEGPRPADDEVTSEPMIRQVEQVYLERVRASSSEVATKAIQEHFASVNAGIRWVEQARVAAEPKHVAALQELAARAYRRPLTQAERADLVAYYRTLRDKDGLTHDEAMRDSVVSVLMAPDFCYRIDLVDAGEGVRPLSDYALASRLSYFLWSSMPDDELLAHAAAGDLRRPDVLVTQARRMLKDPRVRGLATEFGGNWLDFRRFEEHNAVDRERFATFDNALRQAMFEEPVRFMLDVFRENRSVLDFLYAKHTFVNEPLAKHYGVPYAAHTSDGWIRVDDASAYGRGGLLSMAVFLTKNAPGLRTSPVKRGYWVVKQVLGERIPPPPAVVPELPRDEAKSELPLRDMLAKHREDKACASCHARFDSFGLAFEGYGPVGERRTADLAGRPVDDSATFPGGGTGRGVDGLRAYVRERRQDDFVDSLSRKLFAYALSRSLMLSDDLAIEDMRAKLARTNYRFDTLIEAIVTSPQFLTKRGPEQITARR